MVRLAGCHGIAQPDFRAPELSAPPDNRRAGQLPLRRRPPPPRLMPIGSQIPIPGELEDAGFEVWGVKLGGAVCCSSCSSQAGRERYVCGSVGLESFLLSLPGKARSRPLRTALYHWARVAMQHTEVIELKPFGLWQTLFQKPDA